MAAKRRGHTALTKEEWAEKYWQKHAEVQEVRAENRKIQAALNRVLVLRSRLRDEAADSVSEEVDAATAKLDEYEDRLNVAEPALEERDAMLQALGVDEFEWNRMKWKFL